MKGKRRNRHIERTGSVQLRQLRCVECCALDPPVSYVIILIITINNVMNNVTLTEYKTKMMKLCFLLLLLLIVIVVIDYCYCYLIVIYGCTYIDIVLPDSFVFITDDLFGSFDHLQDLLLFRFAQRLNHHRSRSVVAVTTRSRNGRTVRQLLLMSWTIDLFRLDRPTRIQSVSK